MARPLVTERELDGVREVLQSGQLAAGKQVQRLEQDFAKLCDCRYAVATSSGTTALQAAVRALGLSRGDLVITTPLSFVATTNVLLDIGAVPVFVDVDSATFNLSPTAVAAALGRYPGVRAILAVHLYGLPFDSQLVEIARRAGVLLIEDAAQAHGAAVDNRPVGSLGQVAAFSFYPTKNMTTGEGGMVTTDDPVLYERMRLIINQGQRAKYDYACLGFNYRMNELQAALGLAQLEQLAVRNRRRQEIAAYYRQYLPSELNLPVVPAGYQHVFHQFTLSSPHRQRIMTALTRAGIASTVYYPKLISQEDYLAAYPYICTPCPQAEQLSQQVFSIPVHPGLSNAEAALVVEVILREWEAIQRGN